MVGKYSVVSFGGYSHERDDDVTSGPAQATTISKLENLVQLEPKNIDVSRKS